MSGIRVVEFEGWIAGSLLGMLLADQGADVVRIARPGPAIYDHPGASMLARGKRSLVLDLKVEADRDVAAKLASTADIVVENTRPGALDDLGLGVAALQALNPSIIHVRLPGFASDDLMHHGVAAYEGIIAASLGMFTEINLLKPLFGMDPVYSPLALPSIYGAVHGAIACNAALLARTSTGAGASLEVPLAAAAAMAMSSIFMSVEGAPPHYDSPQLPKLIKSVALPLLRRYWRNSPSRQRRFYQKIQSAVPAMMSAYPCADGRLLYVFAIDNGPLATKLLGALGLLEEAKAFGFIAANPYAGPTREPNLATTASLPRKAQAWLRAKIGAALLARSAEEWEAILADAGLPGAVVRTLDEWLNWPPLLDCEAVVENADRRLEPGRQVWFPGEAAQAIRPVPARDQHGAELRAEAKRVRPQKPAPKSTTPGPWQPLAGIKVIDFASMVAGPVAGRTLAELGAQVIKVESPQPHHGPRLTCWYGLDVNQGKRSILVDLKSVDGLSAIAKLINDADVVLHNFTPKAAKRLMLDQPSLSRINPKVIVCDIAAYAGPVPDPIETRHGYDPVLQMASGIAARYGSLDSPELHGIASCIDNLTGYSAAFGIVAALAANARGRDIRTVRTSLVQAANLIQFPYSAAGAVMSEPNGQSALGEDDHTRLWRTRDGWVFTSRNGSSGADQVRSALLGRDPTRISSAEAEVLFRSSGIAAIAIRRIDELRQAFAQGTHSIKSVQRAVDGLTVTQLEPDYIRVNQSRLPSLAGAQKPGAATRATLESIGYSDLAIDSLIASRAAATELSEDFLP